MVLETLNKNLNIKGFIVEDVKKESGRFFDAGRELTKQDWDEIWNIDPIEDDPFRPGHSMDEKMFQISLLSKVYDGSGLVRFKWVEYDSDVTLKMMRDIGEPLFLWKFGTALSVLAMQNPGQKSAFLTNQENYEVSGVLNSQAWKNLTNARILFPDREPKLASVVVNLPDAANLVINKADSFTEITGAAYARLAVWDRLPDYKMPQFVKENLGLTNYYLNRMRQSGEWTNLLTFAFNMSVLTAKEIRMGENGVELIFPEELDLSPATQSLPERRNF